MADYYYPRWAATLTVSAAGGRVSSDTESTETIEFPVKVPEFDLELNDHSHADTLRLTCDWQNVGLDPRLVRNGIVKFYLADSPNGSFQPSDSRDKGNLRFIGRVAEVERQSAEGQPHTVTLEALDYTDFFLRAKPFGSNGIPDYSQTLDAAWQRVVSQTPGASSLSDQLLPFGFSEFPRLAIAVARRRAALSKIPTQPETDAWAVWQQCVGMMGLISFFDRDKLIVTTAEAYYNNADPPTLIWGKNIAELTESRDTTTFSKGVGLSSFDPTTHRTIEAEWPRRNDTSGVTKKRRKQVKAAPASTVAGAEFVKDYVYFTFPGVHDKAQLEKIAKRVFEERTRQELQGTAITSEMRVATVGNQIFDLIDLRAGDSIKIATNENERDVLLRLDSLAAKIIYLTEQGYEAGPARVIALNSEDTARLDDVFYVKKNAIHGETDGDGGRFDIAVSYCNRILVDGSGDTATTG
jgi:hypothetical protein